MNNSPESVVRGWLDAWLDPTVDELVSFFADDGVFVDGPRGVHRGTDALRTEFESELAMGFRMLSLDVKSLVAEDGLVMYERVDTFEVGGQPFSMDIMSAIEVDTDGRIKRWRESYDFQSVSDQLAAAGFRAPA